MKPKDYRYYYKYLLMPIQKEFERLTGEFYELDIWNEYFKKLAGIRSTKELKTPEEVFIFCEMVIDFKINVLDLTHD